MASLLSFFKGKSGSDKLGTEHQLSQGINSFGSTLFAILGPDARKGDAAFLSPWGIAHALAMVLEGAKPGSKSHEELLKVVFAPGAASNPSGDDVRNAMQALTAAITAGNSDALIVSDANSAWVKKDVQLLDSYVQALAKYFEAQANPLESAAVVNAWVTDATRGKITSIVDEQTAARAALVLVNAIYFKGLWEAAFDKRASMPFTFHQMDGSQMRTKMMYLQQKKGTAVQGTKIQATMANGSPLPCVAVKMAYQGGTYSAVVAMPEGEVNEPNNGSPLTLESGMNYQEALTACRQAVVAGLAPTAAAANALQWKTIGDPDMKAIKVYLPRFEVEFSTSLSNSLQSVGVNGIFRAGDFTGITADGQLYVSDVVHKVYVKVDEEGTEAAAVTGVMMMKSAMVRPPPELIFRADRPFVFTIVHEPSGLALFAGEVYKPETIEQ